MPLITRHDRRHAPHVIRCALLAAGLIVGNVTIANAHDARIASTSFGARSGNAVSLRDQTGTGLPHDDSAAVASVVKKFHEALANGDSLTALSLLDPAVTILESGDEERLADYRAHHLAADIEFARAVRSASTPIRVTVRGDVAWATSTSTTTGSFRGRTINSAGAELMVVHRVDGRWRIAAIHWSSHAKRSP